MPFSDKKMGAKLKSVVLDTSRMEVSHTADNIAAALLKVIDDWGISQQRSHTINLIVSNSIAEVPELKEVIQSSKKY